MNIGAYTFKEFKQLAENFHGYAAPGLLIGGYMVEKAKSLLPEGTLFEAVVETAKCLPDAVQLLTLCSMGNMRVKVENLGRYALCLGDKHTGKGIRVSVDPYALAKFPEIEAWFLKKKAKKDQDVELLEREIEKAGYAILKTEEIIVKKRFLGHKHMGLIGICPLCDEAYPLDDGSICRACQGEAPYMLLNSKANILHCPSSHEKVENATEILSSQNSSSIKVVPVEEAINKRIAHDMTRIEPNVFKGAEFKEGQRIRVGDVCRLQQMGRFNVAVYEEGITEEHTDIIHENTVAERFAKAMAGKNVTYKLPPREGKVDFIAECDGLLTLDYKALEQFNLLGYVMCATRQDGMFIKKGNSFAGTRAIPLFLQKEEFSKAMEQLKKPLFDILPLREAKVGILVTGTEVFRGLIEDKFIPVITSKVSQLKSKVVISRIVPDDKNMMIEAIEEIRHEGADILITTGGLSVDPDDITRAVLLEAGLTNVLYGVPVLPGAMSLIGDLPVNNGKNAMQVVGVPACALYNKITFFDLILPRLLANREITRAELARMGEGGYCVSCLTCTWPKCFFGK